jgi:hypothetical protein
MTGVFKTTNVALPKVQGRARTSYNEWINFSRTGSI